SLAFQPLPAQLRWLGWRRWLRRGLSDHAPRFALRALRKYRARDDWNNTAINPEFARRLNLMARKLEDADDFPAHEPREGRCRFIRRGGFFVGAIPAEQGAAVGLEIRDPPADARVLAYCLSTPDRFYFDPATGLDRWLIRQAMKGRLP